MRVCTRVCIVVCVCVYVCAHIMSTVSLFFGRQCLIWIHCRAVCTARLSGATLNVRDASAWLPAHISGARPFRVANYTVIKIAVFVDTHTHTAASACKNVKKEGKIKNKKQKTEKHWALHNVHGTQTQINTHTHTHTFVRCLGAHCAYAAYALHALCKLTKWQKRGKTKSKTGGKSNDVCHCVCMSVPYPYCAPQQRLSSYFDGSVCVCVLNFFRWPLSRAWPTFNTFRPSKTSCKCWLHWTEKEKGRCWLEGGGETVSAFNIFLVWAAPF